MSSRAGILLPTLMLLMLHGLSAQNSSQIGILPALNISKKMSRDYKLNLKAESRLFVHEKGELENAHRLSDIVLVLTKRIGFSHSMGGGFLARIEDGKFISRLIQQYTFAQNIPKLRMVHRLASDQTFEDGSDTEIRLRYRISMQLALSGQNVDPGEFYLKLNNEFLNAFKGDLYDLEIRWAFILGHEFNDNSKIEIGFDHRLDSFVESSSRNRSWINLNWYVTI